MGDFASFGNFWSSGNAMPEVLLAWELVSSTILTCRAGCFSLVCFWGSPGVSGNAIEPHESATNINGRPEEIAYMS